MAKKKEIDMSCQCDEFELIRTAYFMPYNQWCMYHPNSIPELYFQYRSGASAYNREELKFNFTVVYTTCIKSFF